MTSSEQSSVRGQLRRADKVMSDTETHAFLQAAFCGRTASVDRDDDRVCFEVDEPGEVFPYGDLECDTSITPESMTGKIGVLPAVEARWPAVNHSLSPQAPRPTAAPPIKRS